MSEATSNLTALPFSSDTPRRTDTVQSTADLPCVFVVEDDDELRENLLLVLRTAGFLVHGYGSAELFLAEHTPNLTGCVVTDMRLPGMDGMTLIEALNQRRNRLPVIVVSGFADTRLVVRAMRAGTIDFLEKPLKPPLLVAAVRSAMQAAPTTTGLRSEAAAAMRRLASLSARERHVFEQFSSGTTTKQIADGLGLSPKTVETYRGRLMEKLGLDSPAALIRLSVLLAIYGPADRVSPAQDSADPC